MATLHGLAGFMAALIVALLITTSSSVMSDRARLTARIGVAYAAGQLVPSADWGKDLFTECSLLVMQLVRHDNLVLDAIDTRFTHDFRYQPCDTLVHVANVSPIRGISLPEPVSYLNYWFGSRYLAALLLSFAEMRTVRLINLVASYLSIILLLACAVYRSRFLALLLLPITLSLMFCFSLHKFGENIAHSPGYWVGFLLLASFVFFKNRFASFNRRIFFFVFLGCIVTFFDLLHGSLPVALSLTIVLNHFLFAAGPARWPSPSNWRTYLSGTLLQPGIIAACFLAAYVAMTSTKLLFLGVFYRYRIGGYFDALTRRLSTDVGIGRPIGMYDVFDALWSRRDQLTSGGYPVANLVLVAAVICWGFALSSGSIAFLRKRRRIIADVSILTFSSLSIIAWFVLFPNHTYVHAVFDIRMVSLLIAFGFTAAALSLRDHVGQLRAQPGWHARGKLAATSLAPCLVFSLLVADVLFEYNAWVRHYSPLSGRAYFAQNNEVDRVSCAPLGFAGDGKLDRVIRVDLHRDVLQSGLLKLLRGQDVEVLYMRVERASPPGAWETGSTNFILGVSSDLAGPLLNAADGSIHLVSRNSMRFWALFCPDGHDTASSTYHLVVGGRRLQIE
jgi:hypothetical protein